MHFLKYILGSAFFILFIAACNLEKEIDLDLPVYESQPVVECYLEPGKPFYLLLTKSASYFAPFPADITGFLENIQEKGATVIIRNKDKEYLLAEGIYIDFETQKVFNYGNTELVPEDFDNDFELEIRLASGKTITSATKILPIVPIDSVVVEFKSAEVKDSLARVLTYFKDANLSAENFFRRQLHWNSLTDSIPQQDFIATDRFAENGKIVFGTGYTFPEGDTIYNTLYHISPAYFDYLESVFNAAASNGNPFGQPSRIISNLDGDANAIGVFTGLSYVRVMTIVKR